jgi:two-component system nitrogen regulation sensor histidine kinase NtrY
MVATIFLIFTFLKISYYLACTIIVFVLIAQILYLIKYVDKTNRDLANFLESIRFADFSCTFRSHGMGHSFDEVCKAFDNVVRDFQKIRSEKEEHFHYLQSIVQNIDSSILAYRADGEVEIVNKSAKRLFRRPNIKNIKSLESLSCELVQTLLTIRPGRNYLVKVHDDDDFMQLAISASELKIKDKIIIIASISNIQNVLEDQETEAWQKLIRVLTHEIMNSIAPISSLSSTLELMLNNVKNDEKTGLAIIDNESVCEIQQALRTISKRSDGLMHFVNTYRNLTRIPKPNFKITKVIDVLNNIRLLVENEVKLSNIKCEISIETENLEIFADEQLIEQVLLNLIKNSIHALEEVENANISVKAFYNKRGRVTIQVIDNGKGILKDVLDKVFIPFFTTKQNGSGIGLSLSKQILRLHNGSISVQSIPEKETIFTLTF